MSESHAKNGCLKDDKTYSMADFDPHSCCPGYKPYHDSHTDTYTCSKVQTPDPTHHEPKVPDPNQGHAEHVHHGGGDTKAIPVSK